MSAARQEWSERTRGADGGGREKKEDVRKIKRKRRKKATNLEILFGSKIRGDVSPKAGCVISG